MYPLYEGPLGPQRYRAYEDFPSFQEFLSSFVLPVADDRVIEGECVETPDPREDLIHPFID